MRENVPAGRQQCREKAQWLGSPEVITWCYLCFPGQGQELDLIPVGPFYFRILYILRLTRISGTGLCAKREVGPLWLTAATAEKPRAPGVCLHSSAGAPWCLLPLCLTAPSLQLYCHTPAMSKVLPGLPGMEGVMLG